jgi:hypothetical protein
MKFSFENLSKLKELLVELATGMQRLDLNNNFEGFQEDTTILAMNELKIRNKLQYIPTKYIIIDQEGGSLVTRGSTPWTKDFLYMENHGSADVTVSIFFMR